MTETDDNVVPANLGAYERKAGGVVAEVGTSGLRHRQGHISEEFHPRLSGARGLRIYEQMEANSPLLAAAIRGIVTTCEGIAVDVLPGPDGSGEPVDLLRSLLEDMAQPWVETVSDHLATALVFGYSPAEVVLKVRAGETSDPTTSSLEADGAIGIAKVAPRPPHTLESWKITDAGDVVGMHQQPPQGGKRRTIKAPALVVFRTTSRNGNPEGRSLLRGAYRPWHFVSNLEEVEAIGADRTQVGVPKATMPSDYLAADASASKKLAYERMKRIVQSARQAHDAGYVLPAEEYTDSEGRTVKTGFSFQLLGLQGGSGVPIDPIIRRQEHRMALAVLSEIMLLGGDKVGTEALAREKLKRYAANIGALYRRTILDVWNRHIVPRVMALNAIPRRACPRLQMGPALPMPAEDLVTLMGEALSSGALTYDHHVEAGTRQALGLGMLDEGDARFAGGDEE